MKSDLLEQLCRVTLGQESSGEMTPEVAWYLISDAISNIKARSFQDSHPALVIEQSNLKFGFVNVWIRTTSGSGFIPQWIPHASHSQSNAHQCPLNRDAYINVEKSRRIPATHILRTRPCCTMEDISWLRSFEMCLSALRENSESGDF